jgi:hypothetical protein
MSDICSKADFPINTSVYYDMVGVIKSCLACVGLKH